MEKSNNTHIYAGLGTLIFILSAAFLVERLLNKKKLVVKTNKLDTIDYAVFDSPDVKGSGNCIDPVLISRLRELEVKTGYPIFEWINSGVRTPYWNKKVGGVSNSAHRIPNCKAVDIRASSTAIRNELVMSAKEVGFKRIGVGKTFVHLDIDRSKSQNVAWGYPSPAEINPFT